ncbi:putative ATPase [Mycobacterium tuberculosis]|nr:putative ATPase [Mycobacterium tuberculosis]
MRIGILGPLDVRDEAARPVEVGGRRLRALLVRLAAEAGRPVSAERLLDDLWDGAAPGGNALQALVSRLRGVAGRDVVEHGPGGYRLGIDPSEVDAVAFERAVAAARAHDDPARRADGLRAALALWRGPALADAADADFAYGIVTRLEELRLAAVEDRVEAEIAVGRPVPPVAELEPLAAAHPLRERLRGHLMRALYAAGRQAEALEVYEETRRALADRLGVDPSPELAAVHLSILRREPPDPAPEPVVPVPGPAAGAPPGSPRTNLPAQLTSFVGREEESRRVGKLLRETRLVTLTGPGGAGKTRLAGESAAALVEEMPDGVWFVPLAPVSDPADVVQAVLAALGVPESVRPGETRVAVRPLERLTDFLAAKQMVAVLDNCEHVVDEVARLVDHVLAQAPGVRVLATSREPLGITGESLCPVPSLPLPHEDVTDPAGALGYASVRLFADRAAAVRPGFTVDGGTVADVVEICRALDGIPLAIELAAARLRALTSGQVAARLGDRFRLLTGGSRTALPRHRTLRAVVDWSWDLLDDAERAVLRRLSVFAGGASPEAAADVCGLDEVEPHDVIDVVAALIDKSLVMVDGDADVRYRLLETVRVYAAERLEEAGESRRVRDAHAAHLVRLAERVEPELRRRDQLYWAERIAAERDNIAVAFRHVIDTGDAETGLRLIAALLWFWVLRDMEREGGGWAVAVHGMLDGIAPPPGLEEAYALCVVTAGVVSEMSKEPGPTQESMQRMMEGILAAVPEAPMHPVLALIEPTSAIFYGDIDEVRRRLRSLQDHPDPWVRAIASVLRAHMGIHSGDIDEAAPEAADGYAKLRELGDRFGMIVALGAMMQVALARDEPADAVRFGEEAYGYATAGVSPEQGAAILSQLAQARARLGDVARAREDLERGMAQMERIGEFADAANASLLLCELSLKGGDREAARAEAERAYAWVEQRGHRPDFAQAVRRTYSRLGCLAEEDGDLDAARDWHLRTFTGLRNEALMGNPTVSSLVEGLAAYAAARGRFARAAELLGTAHSLHGYRDASSYDVCRTLAAATRALGEDDFDAAYERGRRLGREDVFEQGTDLITSI